MRRLSLPSLSVSCPSLWSLTPFALAALTCLAACKKDEALPGPSGSSSRVGAGGAGGDVPPPPPSAAAKSGACANPATVSDAVSAAFFPKLATTFCIDAAPGAVKTYGVQGELSMDKVCTTAVDGECEVYKTFGLSRLVTLRYIDGAGKGGVVEVMLSQFATEGGAYGMFTKRVVADADPASADAQKPIASVGAAALGGGRANAWRGQYLVELTYMNEEETPPNMVKSSAAILPVLAKSILDKLPGNPEKPAPTRALPEGNMLPLGISYAPKELAGLGIKGLAPTATGFYKDGEKRYRVIAAAPADEAAAKEVMKAVHAKGGALPVPELGDEAFQVVLKTSKEAPKTEWIFARKGTSVMAIGDEDLVLEAGQPLDKQNAIRLVKDEKIAKLKTALH